MQEVDIQDVEMKEVSGVKIYGILGIIQIYPVTYLFVITDCKQVFNINTPERVRIFEILDTQLIVIHKEGDNVNKEYEQAIYKIMKGGFYFSPDVDLTKRFSLDDNEDEEDWERHSELIQDIPTFRIDDRNKEDKFWWNKRLYEKMELGGIREYPWKVHMIRGHVGQDEIFIGNSMLMSVTIISRKATLMGGIIDTGIDDDGSVANFVETEQIMEVEKQFTSFVTVRGSVPGFWDRVNDKINDLRQFYEIELQREFEMHEAAFKLHIKDLVESYQKVVLVNLLDSNSIYELALIKFFEFLLKKYKDKLKKGLKYQYLNFRKEEQSGTLANNVALDNCAEAMKFLWIDNNKKLRSKQKCVVRFNSLNGLHRANRCQSKIAIKVMKSIFDKLDADHIIDNSKTRWVFVSEKIDGLYEQSQAKLCILSGGHGIASKKQIDNGYFQSMYNHVTSLEKMFTNYVYSIQTKEDNLYQEALGKFRPINI